MQKETKIKIVKAVSFSAITGAILTSLALLVFTPLPKEATAYGCFYTEKENSLDLVLVGNSTSREDFIPAEAWHRYGITSHCIGSNPSHLEVIKIAIDEIARTQNPKLVIIDVNGLTFQNQESAPTYVKAYIKAMPDGKAKNALIEKYPYVTESSGFELFKNHNEWRDQYWWETKIFGSYSYNKGYNPQGTKYAITPITVDPDRIDAEWLDIDPGLATNPDKTPHTPRDYLVEILETAKKYPDIDFIFGEMPRWLSDQTEREKLILNRYYELRACQSVVESYGFEWIDFCDHISEIGVDPQTDQRDGDHLNHRGAKLFTKYLGKMVADRYNITKDTHTDSDVVKDFNEAYDDYVKNVDKKLTKKLNIPDSYNE